MKLWGHPIENRGARFPTPEPSTSEEGLGGLLRRREEAEGIARCTEELLASRGWCLWQCNALGGEVIVVAIDGDVPGIPRGKVVYTDAELKELFGGGKPVSPATLRLIHEAKKRASALVASPEALSKEVAGQIPSDAGDAKIPTLEGRGGGKPDHPCFACGSTDWWQRPDGGWVCGVCHPRPEVE